MAAVFERTREFYLTGGAALGGFHLGHRTSLDLDLFTNRDDVDLQLSVSRVEAAAAATGAATESLIANPDFRRLLATRGSESVAVDLVRESVWQARPEKEDHEGILVDPIIEIALNKVCMLVSRSEERDIVDLYFLARGGLEVSALLGDARRKEAALDPAVIAHLLSGRRFREVPGYVVAEVTVEQLNAFVRELENEMAELGAPRADR